MEFVAYLPAMMAADKSVSHRMKLFAACLVAGLAGAVAPAAITPALAEAEPTMEECQVAVDEARALVATLPGGHLSRDFAERHLAQAMTEAGNGEFDECLEMAARATVEVRERRHESPGEKLQVLGPNEYPPEAAGRPQ